MSSDIEKLLGKTKGLTMTAAERKKVSLLIVDSDTSVRHTMRASLLSLGYSMVHDAANHSLALQKVEEHPYSHVIFEAKLGTSGAKEFIRSLLECDQHIVPIPSSYDPTVDDVFELLISGARGFIVKPFTSGALDDSIVMATKADSISDSIAYARNRNEALAGFALAALDRYALLLRQSRRFETAKKEIPVKRASFRRAVDIGKTFAKGGANGLCEAVIATAIQRASDPAATVGKARQRSKEKKEKLRKDPKSPSALSPAQRMKGGQP